jgi:glycosyltransferase involved in cell wall biosynthesis
MDVSVVIPTRDRPDLLALTLRTVLWQEDVSIEVLVVDDGKDSGTAELVHRASDNRVRLLRNNGPRGVSGARNTGIAAAQGQWIAFLDDDDLWAPRKLATQLALPETSRAAWVYAGDVNVDEDLRVIGGAPPAAPQTVVAELRYYNAVPAGSSNVVIRRDLLDEVGRFDPQLQTSEDWDLWLRLAAASAPACVPHPLVALRVHRRMASRRVRQLLADIEIVSRRHNVPLDRARHERWAAWICLEDGHRGRALYYYMRAILAGDLASIGRAAVAAVYSQVARRRPVRRDGWADEAQRWLNALRQTPSRSDDHDGNERRQWT